MNKQIFIYGLTEGGEVMCRTIFEREFEVFEKKGYKRNPLHLPNSIERLSEVIVKGKKEQVKELETVLERMDEAGDSDCEKIQESIALLDEEIKEKEESKTLSEKEMGEFGEAFDITVEVENFLLNLKSEKSKKKICAFLNKYGYVDHKQFKGMKELKAYARKSFGDKD